MSKLADAFRNHAEALLAIKAQIGALGVVTGIIKPETGGQEPTSDPTLN